VVSLLFISCSQKNSGELHASIEKNLENFQEKRLSFLEAQFPKMLFIERNSAEIVSLELASEKVIVNQTKAGKLGGKRVTILITGLDSRLGEGHSHPHADANHVVSLWLDEGKAEVISIPRDTPADAGFHDTSGLNKLTNVRANRGRNTYHKEVVRISGVPKINHYIEFGFSQAMGLLELLGFQDNAKSTLQSLRSRHSYGIGDFQRSYNQGQFIRQMILKQTPKLDDGIMTEVLLRGALLLVDTDLSAEQASSYLQQMKSKGFGKKEDVVVRMKPSMKMQVTAFDFTDPTVVAALQKQNDRTASKQNTGKKSGDEMGMQVGNKLEKLLAASKRNLPKNPKAVIGQLEPYFKQRAWLQVSSTSQRATIRSEFGSQLTQAYSLLKKTDQADRIRTIIEAEEKAFKRN
jgi:anionic cell wall polymer biosynthesis LytR-Cps2A-Psr (LCP) family protein